MYSQTGDTDLGVISTYMKFKVMERRGTEGLDGCPEAFRGATGSSTVLDALFVKFALHSV